MTQWSHLYPDWSASDDGGSTPIVDDGVGDGALFDTIDDLDDDLDDDDLDDDDPGEVEISSGVDEDDDDEDD